MNDEIIKILLIEDNPGDARLIQEMLSGCEKSFSVVELATELSAGIKQLTTGDYEIVLLDLSLPDSQGLHTLADILTTAPDIPVVVLSVCEYHWLSGQSCAPCICLPRT